MRKNVSREKTFVAFKCYKCGTTWESDDYTLEYTGRTTFELHDACPICSVLSFKKAYIDEFTKEGGQ